MTWAHSPQFLLLPLGHCTWLGLAAAETSFSVKDETHSLSTYLCLQVLDKAFMCAVLLMSTMWEGAASSGGARDDMAVALMDALSCLQFCRMRLSVYSLLLQGLLTAIVKSPQVRHAHAAGCFWVVQMCTVWRGLLCTVVGGLP